MITIEKGHSSMILSFIEFCYIVKILRIIIETYRNPILTFFISSLFENYLVHIDVVYEMIICTICTYIRPYAPESKACDNIGLDSNLYLEINMSGEFFYTKPDLFG